MLCSTFVKPRHGVLNEIIEGASKESRSYFHFEESTLFACNIHNFFVMVYEVLKERRNTYFFRNVCKFKTLRFLRIFEEN